jgi:1-deoxy-D-xylulose-5-phosphate synthase
MVQPAMQAATELADEGMRLAVVNARWAKPLDEELILRLARTCGRVITVEDHMVAGGFGSAVLELLARQGLLQEVPIRMIGLPDRFVEHGAPAILQELYGLSSGHIKEVAHDLIGVNTKARQAKRVRG